MSMIEFGALRRRKETAIVLNMSFRETLRFIILACVFATPFVVLYVPDGMFFPFITGKNFTFRILVEVALGAWALLLFIDATYRPKFSWILATTGIFLAVIALADFLGVNPYRSFWSNYERMEGLIAHIHLFLYFIIAGSVLRTEEIWRWFWRTSLGVSLLVAFNAFSQLQGWGAIHQSANRLDATFGNSTYLAVYALFNVFLAMFLFFRESKENPRARFVYPAIAMVNVVIIYYTQTRGAILGLVGGIFLALLLAALFDREHPKWRKYAIGGVIGFVVLVSVFITWRNTPWIQANQTLSRMANISLTDPTTISRFMIWDMSWEGFKERPILGWGQDNFLYVFSKHYNPKMWNQEPWFDRSHNVFFDWLIAGGSIGLISYLSLFLGAIYYIWRKPFQGNGSLDPASPGLGFSRAPALSHAMYAGWQVGSRRLSIIERGVLTGMLLGYFVHNIFVFDNLTSYLIFFAFLAYLHAQNVSVTPPVPEPSRNRKANKENELEIGDLAIASVIIIAVTVGTVYFVNIRNIDANIALINAIRPDGILVTSANGQKEIALKAVLDRGLFGSGEAREQLAQIALQAADPRVPENIREQFFDLTQREFEREIADNPTALRTISFAAAFYLRFGQYDKAREYFTKAIELSPKRQQSYLDLSQLFLIQNDYKNAEAVAKTAYELEPHYPDAALAYATALVYQKNPDETEKVLAPFAGTPLVYDGRLINAYGTNNYFGKVVELVNEKIANGNASGRDYFLLAGGYSGLAQHTQAIAAIQKGMSLDANLQAEGEKMLGQFNGGVR
ncbi:MAG: O-antigen ligase family protein [Patescibacteria group bacterium]